MNDKNENVQHPNIKYSAKESSKHFQARYNGPPSISLMTPEQKSIHDEILKTRPRTGISGPFGPWLSNPHIAHPSQLLGQVCRYNTSLTFYESELIILLTGARHGSATEFDLHTGEALLAGWDPIVIDSIPRRRADEEEFSVLAVKEKLIPLLKLKTVDGLRPRYLKLEEDKYHTFNVDRLVSMVLFAAELLETSTVSDETYERAKQDVGNGEHEILVEITSIIGYYTYVSYTLNVFRIPS